MQKVRTPTFPVCVPGAERCLRSEKRVAGTDLQVVQGVGFEDAEEGLLALSKAKLGVLGEGAVDVSCDDLIHLFLPNADLQQRVVTRLFPVLCADGPWDIHHCRHDPCTTCMDLLIGRHTFSSELA